MVLHHLKNKIIPGIVSMLNHHSDIYLGFVLKHTKDVASVLKYEYANRKYCEFLFPAILFLMREYAISLRLFQFLKPCWSAVKTYWLCSEERKKKQCYNAALSFQIAKEFRTVELRWNSCEHNWLTDSFMRDKNEVICINSLNDIVIYHSFTYFISNFWKVAPSSLYPNTSNNISSLFFM